MLGKVATISKEQHQHPNWGLAVSAVFAVKAATTGLGIFGKA